MRNLLVIISFLVFIYACNHKPKSEYINFNGFTQGTTYNITYESFDLKNYKSEIENILAEFDTSLSTYNSESVISKINRNESFETDEWFRYVYIKSEEVYYQSKGAFDITVAPLVNVWGFGFKNKANVTNAMIDSILRFVGFQNVCLKDSL